LKRHAADEVPNSKPQKIIKLTVKPPSQPLKNTASTSSSSSSSSSHSKKRQHTPEEEKKHSSKKHKTIHDHRIFN
jgi:hypothetical protein